MPGWILFPLALLITLLEGVVLALLGWEQLTFQFGLACVTVITLHRDFTTAGLICAALLVPIEWSVGGPIGYYAFASVIIFFFLQLIRGRVRFGPVESVLVGAGVGFVHGIAMIVMLALTEPSSNIINVIASNLIGSAVMTAISVGLTFGAFSVGEKRFKPIRGNQLSIPI